ncbi:leucine-rich repeat-containing protein 23-like [Tribolium madens]|uniref:leucine-rich repeat-containing protein 23-like n=1 Tax=Tribolium madens TaxID=41895 RepID=UPI001CF72B8E|nr:leucine-rich repeat-containing protein 23-like [Tribolium madens]
MGEDFGEGGPPIPGEGVRQFGPPTAPSIPEVIKEKKLTFEEASKCLNTLGKDETGSRYAYLMITASNRKLTDVSIILRFKHVLFLDLSGNYLTTDALQVLTEMPFLILLKAERNRVDSAALKPMPYLQVLALNQNQIKQVGNIDQPLLDCLEMNYNDIYNTEFETANLKQLKQLEMRSNLLFEISGFYPPNLRKLYMAANKITTINSPEFAKLAYLEILHLRENNIQNLDGFSEAQTSLKYINLRNNKIEKFKEFRKLQCLPNLETLIVTGNPLPGSEVPQTGEGGGGVFGEGGKIRDPVVIPLLVLLPKLKRINKTVITMEDRIDAEDMENDVIEALLRDDETAQDTDRETTTTDYKQESDLDE